MAKRQEKVQTPIIGGSSLLVIFAVLCMTVFALLGFGTVQANRRLEQASVAAVTAYYGADSWAEEVLAQLRAGEAVQGVTVSDDVYSYACPISDTQVLQVSVRLRDANDWEVLRWQTVPIPHENADEYIDVWNGG